MCCGSTGSATGAVHHRRTTIDGNTRRPLIVRSKARLLDLLRRSAGVARTGLRIARTRVVHQGNATLPDERSQATSVAVGLTAVQDVKNDHLATSMVKCKPNTPVAYAEPIFTAERLDGFNVALPLGRKTMHALQDLRSRWEIQPRELLARWLRELDCPVHNSTPVSFARSSSEMVPSPARNDLRAASTARCSSSVSGSSDTGAFINARVTGSSFSATGMPQVWHRSAPMPRTARMPPQWRVTWARSVRNLEQPQRVANSPDILHPQVPRRSPMGSKSPPLSRQH